MLKKVKIKDLAEHLELIYAFPFGFGNNAESCLDRLSTGNHVMFVDDQDKDVLIIMRSVSSDHVRMVALQAPNKLKKHKKELVSLLRASGIKKISAFSNHKQEPYERLTGMKKVSTYYEMDI